MKIGELVRRREAIWINPESEGECGVVVDFVHHKKSERPLIRIYMCGKVSRWKKAAWYETIRD